MIDTNAQKLDRQNRLARLAELAEARAVIAQIRKNGGAICLGPDGFAVDADCSDEHYAYLCAHYPAVSAALWAEITESD